MANKPENTISDAEAQEFVLSAIRPQCGGCTPACPVFRFNRGGERNIALNGPTLCQASMLEFENFGNRNEIKDYLARIRDNIKPLLGERYSDLTLEELENHLKSIETRVLQPIFPNEY